MKLGALTVQLVDDGGFRLDGGGLFGAVPKVLWQRHKPADEQNRVAVVTNCLLIERGSDLVLVDTGIGDKGDAKFARNFGLDPQATRLPQQIEQAGFALGDVTHVVLTHLHFDHCGWNTRADAAGAWVPTFPHARYWIARGEVAHARAPNARDRASYDTRNWEPLFEAGCVELFDDTAEPVEGIRAVRAPGHNEDMCVVRLDGGAPDAQAVFLADLVPTPAHVPTAWVAAFDLLPVVTMETKQAWLRRAFDERWLCLFQHEPDAPLGRLEEPRPGRLQAVPA